MSSLPSLTIRSATPADDRDIHDLLQRCALPTGDLTAARPQFVIAQDAGRIVGTGALQRFGSVALLRSVAVETQWRGCGVGRLIVEELERRARTTGIEELILLTLTARDFFERLGYGATGREQVPSPVLDSAEFRSLCPASAVCMSKAIR